MQNQNVLQHSTLEFLSFKPANLCCDMTSRHDAMFFAHDSYSKLHGYMGIETIQGLCSQKNNLQS